MVFMDIHEFVCVHLYGCSKNCLMTFCSFCGSFSMFLDEVLMLEMFRYDVFKKAFWRKFGCDGFL